jgi:hypothetical protein
MIRNITRRVPPTPEELQARDAFLEQSRRDADRTNSEAMIASRQIQEAAFQDKLVADTRLDLSQLQAIKNWLAANP